MDSFLMNQTRKEVKRMPKGGPTPSCFSVEVRGMKPGTMRFRPELLRRLNNKLVQAATEGRSSNTAPIEREKT
jgi:hypothetical protein